MHSCPHLQLPPPPAYTPSSLPLQLTAHTRTRTGRHVAAVEERGDRKRQVSILTDIHTAGLEKMQSTSGDTDKSILILPLLPSGEKT